MLTSKIKMSLNLTRVVVLIIDSVFTMREVVCKPTTLIKLPAIKWRYVRLLIDDSQRREISTLRYWYKIIYY